MYLFKVTFKDNKAFSTDHLFVPQHQSVQMERVHGCHQLKSITVFAENAAESMRIADRTIKDMATHLKVA